jgi:hypothetical protein
MYFKHDGYHKERELGYRNDRGTRRRGCIPVFPCFATSVTFGGVEVPRRIPRATKAHPILRSLSHEGIAHSLVVDFEVASKPSQSCQEQIHSPDASGPLLPTQGFQGTLESKLLDEYTGE